MRNEDFQTIEIESSYQQAKIVEQAVLKQANDFGYNGESIFALQLSLEEALTNAIRHGNAGESDRKVKIRYRVNSQAVDIYIADEGVGFDPCIVPDPTLPENLSRPNGRGILLMRAYMSCIEYNAAGNEVHMVLNRK